MRLDRLAEGYEAAIVEAQEREPQCRRSDRDEATPSRQGVTARDRKASYPTDRLRSVCVRDREPIGVPRVSILCYHSVDPSWGSHLAMTPEGFERHCRWLSRARTVLSVDECMAAWTETGRMPQASVSLTFDDGFVDLAQWAFPVLARYRLHATVFLVAETLTAQGRAVDWVDDAPPWPLRTLTPEHVLAARADGIRFASHSWAHRDLVQLSEGECIRDLRDSREFIEDLLHEPVPLLAYPFGRHDPMVERAARRAGYQFAFALPDRCEVASRYAIPRVGIFRGDGAGTLRIKTADWWLPLRYSPVFPLLRKISGRGLARSSQLAG